MKKIITILIVLLSSCTLRPHERRGSKRKPISLDQYIDRKLNNKISEYKEQFKTESYQKPPRELVKFGDITWEAPRHRRVYRRQKELKHGKYSEVIGEGWSYIYDKKRGGVIRYSYGSEEHPTIGGPAEIPGKQK